MIRNPILPGFNPDPCICRKGDSTIIWLSLLLSGFRNSCTSFERI